MLLTANAIRAKLSSFVFKWKRCALFYADDEFTALEKTVLMLCCKYNEARLDYSMILL